MPLDYSKWDKLDDSDDEEEAKPASPKKVAAALEGNMRANPFPCLTGARRAGGGGGGAGEAREAQGGPRQCMERKCTY